MKDLADLSEKRDSNPRPRPWQGRALPTELFSHCYFRTLSLSQKGEAKVIIFLKNQNFIHKKYFRFL